jgi:hypothetical protein
MARLRADEKTAAAEVFQRFTRRLIGLARSHLDTCLVELPRLLPAPQTSWLGDQLVSSAWCLISTSGTEAQVCQKFRKMLAIVRGREDNRRGVTYYNGFPFTHEGHGMQ